jgi:hypothetical protein
MSGPMSGPRRGTPPRRIALPPRLFPEGYVASRRARDEDKRRKTWKDVDWTKKLKSLDPAQFQQDPGSDGCVGFALAAAMRACFHLRRGQDPGALNPYFLAALVRDRDQGGNDPTSELRQGIAIANAHGTPTLGQGPKGLPPAPFTEAPRYLEAARAHRTKSFTDLGVWMQDWYDWLQAKGPVVVQLNVDASFDAAGRWVEYDARGPLQDLRGHALVLVGYDKAEDAFILMNSYGPQWKERGFARIKVDVAQRCFVAGYGPYVSKASSSAPPSSTAA